MLILGRKPNEVVIINGNIKVSVLSLQGRQVRLGFEAPEEIEIHRLEVFEKIQKGKTRRNASEGN